MVIHYSAFLLSSCRQSLVGPVETALSTGLTEPRRGHNGAVGEHRWHIQRNRMHSFQLVAAISRTRPTANIENGYTARFTGSRWPITAYLVRLLANYHLANTPRTLPIPCTSFLALEKQLATSICCVIHLQKYYTMRYSIFACAQTLTKWPA